MTNPVHNREYFDFLFSHTFFGSFNSLKPTLHAKQLKFIIQSSIRKRVATNDKCLP